MSLSIRNVLIGIFLILSASICALTANSIIGAYGSYRAYTDVSSLTELDKAIFNALVNFRNERGNGASALKMESDAYTASVKTMKENRIGVDSAIADARSVIASIDREDVKGPVSSVMGIFDRWAALRTQIDDNLGKALADRDPKLAQASLELGQELLTALENTSGSTEAQIRSSDPGLAALIQMRTLGWGTRASAGVTILTINTTLAAGEVMSEDLFTRVLTSESVAVSTWKQLSTLVEHPSTPDEIKKAYATADASYFKGEFATMRAALIGKFKAGEKQPIALDEWSQHTTAALKSVANVPSVSVDEMTHAAKESQQQAFTSMLGYLAIFVAILGFSTVGILVIVFRVTRLGRAVTKSTSERRHIAWRGGVKSGQW